MASSDDYVFTLAQREIHKRNTSTFGNFLTPIALDRCTITNCHGDKLHHLTPYRQHLFHVHLGLLDDSRVLIRTGETWVALEKYLEIYSSKRRVGSGNYFCSYSPSRPEMSATIHKFWSANGRTFPFLDLPAELRNEVYRFAMCPKAYPYKYKNNPIQSKYFHIDEAPNTSLLRVNKLVRREASMILFKDTAFCFFENFSPLFFSQAVGPIHKGSLRELELSFNHMGFLNFFGADLGYEHTKLEEPEAAKVLGKLSLHRLCLRFPHPSELRRYRWLKTGCQTTICSWILEAAEPYLKRIPKVELEGSIKTKQKKDFLAYLEEQRQGGSGARGVLLLTPQARLRTL